MTNTSDELLHALAENGYRVTSARRNIVEAVVKSTTPVTIQELAQLVSADTASVYRTVSLLTERGLLEEIKVRGGRSRYATARHHHHHVVCRGCGVIAHTDCDQSLSAPKNIPGFAQIDEHEVTFYGLCQTCQ